LPLLKFQPSYIEEISCFDGQLVQMTANRHGRLLYHLSLFLYKTQFIHIWNVLWICQQWRYLLNNKRVFTNETYSHILTSYTASLLQFHQNSL